jgi:hypothetical protein
VPGAGFSKPTKYPQMSLGKNRYAADRKNPLHLWKAEIRFVLYPHHPTEKPL